MLPKELVLGEIYEAAHGDVFVPVAQRVCLSSDDTRVCCVGQHYYVALALEGLHKPGVFFHFGVGSAMHERASLVRFPPQT